MKKNTGLYLEGDRYTLRTAQVSGSPSSFRLDSISEFEPDFSFIRTASGLPQKRMQKAYMPAICAFSPKERFFYIHKVQNAAKSREPDYWDTVLKNFRLSPSDVRYAVLQSSTGEHFGAMDSGIGGRDFLVCGASRVDWGRIQDELLRENIVPQSLELAGLNAVAGLLDYLKFRQIVSPLLYLEMGSENSTLFILSGGQVTLCRHVSFGYQSVLPVICTELGLKDTESASRLFFSNTFDFRDIGGVLFSRLLKELNAASGFYEMQTGQALYGFFMTGIPRGLEWVGEILADGLEIELFGIEWKDWFEMHGIQIGENLDANDFKMSHFPLFSLMMQYAYANDES